MDKDEETKLMKGGYISKEFAREIELNMKYGMPPKKEEKQHEREKKKGDSGMDKDGSGDAPIHIHLDNWIIRLREERRANG